MTYNDEFRFMAVREMQVRPIEWLVHGIIESHSVVSLFGPAGVAKTFYAIDMACCVASDLPFHDHDVVSGGVFYVLGEGYSGISRRIQAWAEHHQKPQPEHLYISNRALDLFHLSGPQKLVAEIEAVVEKTGTTPKLLVVDTLARNFSGEENSARDISQFIQNIDDIRFRWDLAVMIVHHTGKDADRGARGSTALRSAVDAEYEVTRGRGQVIQVTCRKMKDGPALEAQAYTLLDVSSITSESETIQSAVLQRVEMGAQVREPSGKNQKRALDVLRRLYSDLAGNGHDDPIVSESGWRAHCRADLEPNRIKEAINGLERSGFVKIEADRAVLMDWQPPENPSENATFPTDSYSSELRHLAVEI